MPQAPSDCPVALVVENDEAARDLAAALIEETDLDVIACSSAEDALAVLERDDVTVAMVVADTRLSGKMDGATLARTVEDRWPQVRLVVTSEGTPRADLPPHAVYMSKPWLPLDLLRQAERATLTARAA
ncbi:MULTISPECIES: response regulator [Methylorubrum]|jgi:DNA-binding NtrC family response regulator|uniref:Hydrogenase transcriptional regulatory protein hupR1 n=1 Tax=Methylorubrum suomiense TaxID=144191 RepID=A0ABQ4V1P1_9HYPH|nr:MULTISPECIES: response regulator [Methylobacteriaceae]GJE77984.1 Hydrogenase transcriptional regulatory protein hupR1 [Methylorubrum suomiense]